MERPVEISNPVTSGRAVFDEEASSEQVLVMHSWEPAGLAPPPLHWHPNHEETFIVHEGHIMLHLDGEDHRIEAGERITVPPGAEHIFWTEDSPAEVTVEIRPPDGWRAFMTDFFALFHAVGEPTGFGGMLQMVMFARAHPGVVVLAQPPPAVQRILFPILSGIGRVMGMRAVYPYPDEAEPSQASAEVAAR